MPEETKVEEVKEAQVEEVQQKQPSPEEILNLKINSEIKFAEETILRAFRSAIVNVSNLLSENR